jgi:hypothetical protein
MDEAEEEKKMTTIKDTIKQRRHGVTLTLPGINPPEVTSSSEAPTVVAKVPRWPSPSVLCVDCVPAKTRYEVQTVQEYAAAVMKTFYEKHEGIYHFRQLDYGQGLGEVAALARARLLEQGAWEGVVVMSSRDAMGVALLDVLSEFADTVIWG